MNKNKAAVAEALPVAPAPGPEPGQTPAVTPELMPGQMKVLSRTLKLATRSRIELHNLSDRIREEVRASGIRAGFLVVSTLHTTTALFMNEFQAALMADLTEFLERIVDPDGGYLHNCEDTSDCERKNAAAHLRATLLGQNVTIPIADGEAKLGQWQSILFAELDGPKPRTVTAHLIGV